MTLDEAKDAVQHRKRVIFNGAEYIANGIITWWDNHSGMHQGWRNSLDLIAVNDRPPVPRLWCVNALLLKEV